jgi:hypothetical protein
LPNFTKTENSATHLRDEIGGLLAAGLNGDEAEAMLNTWEASYFKSPGQRLFLIVSPGWTDRVLPLRISVPAEVKRVMVGRVELVTPAQRRAARAIASGATDTGRLYGSLGRFRDATLLDQQRREPTAALNDFVRGNVRVYGRESRK